MHSVIRSATLVLPQPAKLVATAPLSGGATMLQSPQMKPKMQSGCQTADPFMGQQKVKPLPGQISVQPLHRGNVSAVLDMVLSAYLDTAPLNRAVGLQTDEAEMPYGEKIEQCADEGNSFMALDQETGNIVGVILNEKLLKGRFHYTSKYPEKQNKIEKFLLHVEGDQFAQLQDATKIFKIHDALVTPGYQNHGIAKQLMSTALAEACVQKCDYITGTATSPLTKRILQEKIQFVPIRSCNTKTYADPETQEMPFQCIAHSSPQVTFMARKLDTTKDHTRHRMG